MCVPGLRRVIEDRDSFRLPAVLVIDLSRTGRHILSLNRLFRLSHRFVMFAHNEKLIVLAVITGSNAFQHMAAGLRRAAMLLPVCR